MDVAYISSRLSHEIKQFEDVGQKKVSHLKTASVVTTVFIMASFAFAAFGASFLGPAINANLWWSPLGGVGGWLVFAVAKVILESKVVSMEKAYKENRAYENILEHDIDLGRRHDIDLGRSDCLSTDHIPDIDRRFKCDRQKPKSLINKPNRKGRDVLDVVSRYDLAGRVAIKSRVVSPEGTGSDSLKLWEMKKAARRAKDKFLRNGNLKAFEQAISENCSKVYVREGENSFLTQLLSTKSEESILIMLYKQLSRFKREGFGFELPKFSDAIFSTSKMQVVSQMRKQVEYVRLYKSLVELKNLFGLLEKMNEFETLSEYQIASKSRRLDELEHCCNFNIELPDKNSVDIKEITQMRKQIEYVQLYRKLYKLKKDGFPVTLPSTGLSINIEGLSPMRKQLVYMKRLENEINQCRDLLKSCCVGLDRAFNDLNKDQQVGFENEQSRRAELGNNLIALKAKLKELKSNSTFSYEKAYKYCQAECKRIKEFRQKSIKTLAKQANSLILDLANKALGPQQSSKPNGLNGLVSLPPSFKKIDDKICSLRRCDHMLVKYGIKIAISITMVVLSYYPALTSIYIDMALFGALMAQTGLMMYMNSVIQRKEKDKLALQLEERSRHSSDISVSYTDRAFYPELERFSDLKAKRRFVLFGKSSTDMRTVSRIQAEVKDSLPQKIKPFSKSESKRIKAYIEKREICREMLDSCLDKISYA